MRRITICRLIWFLVDYRWVLLLITPGLRTLKIATKRWRITSSWRLISIIFLKIVLILKWRMLKLWLLLCILKAVLLLMLLVLWLLMCCLSPRRIYRNVGYLLWNILQIRRRYLRKYIAKLVITFGRLEIKMRI